MIVVLYLTNKDGDYTKANGNLKILVHDDRKDYRDSFDFTKDDFSTFNTLFGEKRTGFRVDVREYFSSGDHDVFADVVLESGSAWTGDNNLHASFYSLN